MMLGCMTVLSGCSASYVDEGKDALDPRGYAAAGYYGKSQEELKELLPGLEYGGEPTMVLESRVSETVSCKQVFYFYEDELVQIDYEYLFDVGEDAERKFIKQCERLCEIDSEAMMTGWLGEITMNVDQFLNRYITTYTSFEADGLFWKQIIGTTPYLTTPNTIGFLSFCDEENRMDHRTKLDGLKKKYRIEISGSFYHWYVDWEKLDGGYCTDEDMERSNASFLGGKEARITLRIATWD